MTRESRFDPLFEPIQIGPVTAKNRFYQVPHCSGMGFDRPRTLNRMREVNAEGGWAMVCTEFCSIHPSAISNKQCTLWDDDDVRMLADMAERVYEHGALAGVQLWYGGYSSYNGLTRELPVAPHSMPVWRGPGQSQAMDKADIRNLRKWHRDAALRARRADFDIVYVYADASPALAATAPTWTRRQRLGTHGAVARRRVFSRDCAVSRARTLTPRRRRDGLGARQNLEAAIERIGNLIDVLLAQAQGRDHAQHAAVRA